MMMKGVESVEGTGTEIVNGTETGAVGTGTEIATGTETAIGAETEIATERGTAGETETATVIEEETATGTIGMTLLNSHNIPPPPLSSKILSHSLPSFTNHIEFVFTATYTLHEKKLRLYICTCTFLNLKYISFKAGM